MTANARSAAKIDPDRISGLIRECAAKYIIPRFKKLAQGDISTKTGPHDLVTVADSETEEALDSALTKMYPGSVVIGEEGISAGKKSADILQDKTRTIWVADPVDGTYNFVHGNPEFAVMLACVVDGETRFGWIYDVPADRMLTAEKGAGAFIEGRRLKVAGPKPPNEARGFTGSRYFPKHLRPLIKSFVKDFEAVHTLSCAGHEYIRLASGEYDFSIYNRIRPWDHLPGTLAVSEAGGFTTKWDGSAYTPQDDGGGLVNAANETLLEMLHEKIISKLVEGYEQKS
jgi:fructose-1,6-bisphosphatase/inositol monophosphatase family enzyme